MGSALGLSRKKERKILQVGLDAAGKSSILYRLRLGEVVTTIPTIGFNVETVVHRNTTFYTWDVGGKDKIRPLWRHYYQQTNAIIFVVDSHDHDRIYDACEELMKMLREDDLRGVPLLIFANKQDLPYSLSVEDIVDTFDLHNMQDRPWHIFASSAVTGLGLLEGLDWLSAAMDPPPERIPCGPDVWPKPRRVEWPGSYVVEARSLELWDQIEPPRVRMGSVSKGDTIEVVEVVAHARMPALTHCRINVEGGTAWLTLQARSVSAADLVVTLSCASQDNGNLSIVGTSIGGEELARFLLPAGDTVASLRESLAGALKANAWRLKLVLVDGRLLELSGDATTVGEALLPKTKEKHSGDRQPTCEPSEHRARQTG